MSEISKKRNLESSGALEQRQAVVDETLSWLGTPYHHHGRVKAVGVDCAMLLAEVYQACGLVQRVEPGFYPHDWHLHRGEELFIQWVERLGAREVPAPKLGDIGVWRYGRTFSHGGIVVDVPAFGAPLVLHAYIDTPVNITRTDEAPLSGRAVRWYSMWEAR